MGSYKDDSQSADNLRLVRQSLHGISEASDLLHMLALWDNFAAYSC